MSKNIVIVYHSGYGHTAKIAEAVAAGSGGALLAIVGGLLVVFAYGAGSASLDQRRAAA